MANEVAASAGLNDADLACAIRYMLQLAIEWEADGGAYEEGGALLTRVVAELDAHRKRRQLLRQRAELAELVQPIMERLEAVKAGATQPTQTFAVVSKWLRRRGIEKTSAEVKDLFSSDVRRGAKKRTRREKLLDHLASIVNMSQSEFEKIVRVVERGKQKPGRMGNVFLHERAAIDRPPSRRELMSCALDAIGVDVETRLSAEPPLPRMGGGETDEIILDLVQRVVPPHDRRADRRRAAELLKVGTSLKDGDAQDSPEVSGKSGAAEPPKPTTTTTKKGRRGPGRQM